MLLSSIHLVKPSCVLFIDSYIHFMISRLLLLCQAAVIVPVSIPNVLAGFLFYQYSCDNNYFPVRFPHRYMLFSRFILVTLTVFTPFKSRKTSSLCASSFNLKKLSSVLDFVLIQLEQDCYVYMKVIFNPLNMFARWQFENMTSARQVQ